MKASERREQILTILENAEEAVSATALASQLGVSRQIIVGDVALLRAAGGDIISTPRGYALQREALETKGRVIRQFASLHNADEMLEELQICVDQGCSVLDVIVDHPIYGQLTGQLMLESRYDIDQFMEKVKAADAHSLCELTDGIHIHTLSCPSQAAFDRVEKELRERGFLYEQ